MGARVADVVTGESLSRDPLDFNAVVTLSQARAADGDEETAAGGEAGFEQVAQADADTMSDQVAATADGADAAEEDLWFDPEQRELTRSELRLLQELSERRQALNDRERGLDQRAALLDAAEARFEEKLTELTALRDQISQLLDQHSEQQEAQLANLVAIYESMKPKDAARIFDSLDMDVLLDVVVRMKQVRSAAILAEMQPNRAKDVTLQLADRRRLPDAIEVQ
ncbi:MAG: hypothetical protein KI792_03985 [Alphaproteobacteria bacterium]|nr:hypothetical protein [Alphaproteobacteria bacterium SS10]